MDNQITDATNCDICNSPEGVVTIIGLTHWVLCSYCYTERVNS